jgi:hypothetical protein
VDEAVYVLERAAHGFPVADVPDPELSFGIEIVGRLRMDLRVEGVEHADLVAGRQQRVDDVRADEAGSSRYEYAHRPEPIVRTQ